MRILLAEDEPRIANFVSKGLRENSYAVDVVNNGEDAVYQNSISDYDLIILDVMMPLKNGFEVCRDLRNSGNKTPILMLTARDAVEDRISGLDFGADDYLVKPFEFGELLARLRALLRRQKELRPGKIIIADLEIDIVSQKVRRGGNEILLTAKEYALLEYLARDWHCCGEFRRETHERNMKKTLNLAFVCYFATVGFGETKPTTGAEYFTDAANFKYDSRAAEQQFQKRFSGGATSGFDSAIYIAADRRHQGLSRFDLIPFTNRKKGDPDRYRAVNPKYVKRENGGYYYDLQVKVDTHYFDENLQDKGILPELNVKVDLTQTKTAKASVGGKTIKYIYVKDKGYITSEALLQKSSEIKSGRWFYFPIKSGEPNLYDGSGVVRGKLAADAVRLNYGLQKEIKGEIYYYAFSNKLKINNETIGASGWIKASAIEAGNDPQFDMDFVKKMQMPTAATDTFTKYEITGGNQQEISGKDENGAIKYKFGYADKNGNFVAYKVLPRIPLDGNQSVASTDYLKRSDAVINLGFNVAGVSNDTFRIDGANRPLVFHRSSDKEATAVIDLFYPKDAAHDGEKVVAQMIFVYGYVAVGGDKRWGWIPLDALKLKSKKTRLK